MAITTVDSLRSHLQWAIEIEHGTLPPYLCALYSIEEGANEEAIGSPVVLVRLAQDELHLPRELARYPADGIVAYSKICTHAGCAISLYRAPLFTPDEPGPALVCPCHYSTFDPATGAGVLFGPAGRPLPQLPLLVDRRGELRAAGDFSGPVGPSWWGVRKREKCHEGHSQFAARIRRYRGGQR